MFHTRSIPNLLGLFRIVATPLLMWLIVQGTSVAYLWGALLLIVVALTDLIDGPIARWLRVVSPLGIFLDTISDKIFVVGVLLPLVERGLLSGWIALVIIVREFLVSGLRSFAAAEGQVISAGIWGKQKLVITVVALVWRLLAASFVADPQQFGGNALYSFFVQLWPLPMALAVIWTLFSAGDYLWKVWPLLRTSWKPFATQEPPRSASPGSGSAPADTPDIHR